MRVTDNSTYRTMQTNLDRITTELLVLRSQGATGLKLNKPSDDPGAIRPVLTAKTQLQEIDRHLATLGHTGDTMASTDSHLANIENTLVRAKEIVISAINGIRNPADLATLADEMASLKDQLLYSANAAIDGKYIFAGFKEDVVPFTENPAYDPDLYDVSDTATWPYIYNGDHNTTQLEITPDEFLETNLTGNELFLGISNEIAASGSSSPYQGESLTSTSIGPGTPGDDITITAGTNTVTISGADLTDTDDNYAAKVAALFNQPDGGLTGLAGTVNPAVVDAGPLTLTDFVDGEDTYTLDITSDSGTVTVTLDGTTYDYSLTGMAWALANSTGASNLSPTGGTLANGVSYSIASGSLVLTGRPDGSEIELSETIGNPDLTAPVPTGGITGGSPQTVYGTINIATLSTVDVEIAGDAGLADLGLTAATLSGASGKVDIFTILTRAEEAIRANNIDDINGAGGSMESQLNNLEIAADQNRILRSNLGFKALRVDSATAHQQDAAVDLQQIVSRYQDADMIAVFNDIIKQETAFKTALSITGRISDISILDYL